MKDQLPESEYQRIAADIHKENSVEYGADAIRRHTRRLGPIAISRVFARSLLSRPQSERTWLSATEIIVKACKDAESRLFVLQTMRSIQAPCRRGMYYSHCQPLLGLPECLSLFADRNNFLAEVAAAMPEHRRNNVSDPCTPCEGKLRNAQDLVLSDLTSLFVHRSPALIDSNNWSSDPIGSALLIRVLCVVWFVRYAGSRLCIFDGLKPSFCRLWQGRTLQTLALIDASGDGWKKFGTSTRIRRELEGVVREWRNAKQSPKNPFK